MQTTTSLRRLSALILSLFAVGSLFAQDVPAKSTRERFADSYLKTVREALGNTSGDLGQDFWENAYKTVFGPRTPDSSAVERAKEVFAQGKDFSLLTEDFRAASADLPVFHADTPAGQKMKADLDALMARLKAKSTLEPADLKELLDKLAPFLRTAELGRRAQNPSVVVQPKTTVVLHTNTFCLQHDVPAPGANEPHSLIASSLLIPPGAKEIYDGLLAYAPSHQADKAIIQTLLWAIRHANTTPPPDPSDEQKRVLDSALTDGAKKYVDFIHSLKAGAKPSEEPKKPGLLTLQGAAQDIAINNLANAGVVQHSGDINNPADVASILQQLTQARRTQAAPVPSVSGGQAAGSPANPPGGATLLAPDVAAKATSDAGLSGVTVQITNASDTPYTYRPTDFVALNDNAVTQPLALTGPSFGNFTDADVQTAESTLQQWVNYMSERPELSELEGIGGGLLADWIPNRFASAVVQATVKAIPIVGQAISGYEFISGKDFFTGHELNTFQRMAAGLSTATLGLSLIKNGATLTNELFSTVQAIDATRNYENAAARAINLAADTERYSKILEPMAKGSNYLGTFTKVEKQLSEGQTNQAGETAFKAAVKELMKSLLKGRTGQTHPDSHNPPDRNPGSRVPQEFRLQPGDSTYESIPLAA